MKPIFVSLVLSAIGLYAQTPDPVCSNATLKGSYGIIVTGTESAPSVLPQFPSNLYPIGSLETFIGVVVHTFDGNGKFTQVDHVKGSLSGPILDRPGGGTYTVKPDCSGTYSLVIPGVPFPVLVVRFVIVDGGKELRGIVVVPQEAMSVANGRKM